MNVPYVTTMGTTELFRFAALDQAARQNNRTRAVRTLVFSDSRGTYGGQGANSNPLESYRNWQMYGNTPETGLTLVSAFGNNVRGDATGYFGIAGADLGDQATIRTANTVPWGLEGALSYSRKWIAAVYYVPLYQLQPKAESILPSTAYIPAQQYIGTTGRWEVFVPRETTNFATLNWSSHVSAVGQSYFDTEIANGTVNTAAATSVQGDVLSCVGVEGPVRSYLLPTYNWGGGSAVPLLSTDYATLLVGSNDGTTGTEFVGVLWRSANTAGIGTTYCGAGGKTAADLLAAIVNWWPSINAIGADRISLRFGANDAPGGVSAATFQTTLQSIVDLIKANATTGDGVSAPLIEIESPYDQTGLTAPQRAAFDQYGAAGAAVAAINTGVRALDIRAASEATGWSNAADLLDNVHQNVDGAVITSAARATMIRNVITMGLGRAGRSRRMCRAVRN